MSILRYGLVEEVSAIRRVARRASASRQGFAATTNVYFRWISQRSAFGILASRSSASKPRRRSAAAFVAADRETANTHLRAYRCSSEPMREPAVTRFVGAK
jgi:hypothetical protein